MTTRTRPFKLVQFLGLLHEFSSSRQVIMEEEGGDADAELPIETAEAVLSEFQQMHPNVLLKPYQEEEVREALLRVWKVVDLGQGGD